MRGIAVIRISGRGAVQEQGKILNSLVPYHFSLIIDEGGRLVDEVLIVFHSPSYIGEAVEISCHGGVLVTQRVFETLLATGIQPAEAEVYSELSKW